MDLKGSPLECRTYSLEKLIHCDNVVFSDEKKKVLLLLSNKLRKVRFTTVSCQGTHRRCQGLPWAGGICR